MAATFQNLSGGRLLLNVVTGGESHEQRDVRRLPRQGRPLRALRRVPRRSSAGCGPARRSTSTASTSRSRTPRLASRSPTRSRRSTSAAPPPAAGRVAAKHVDVYLTWGEPPAAVAEKIAWIRELAAERGPRDPVRHPACTPSPATPPRRRGPRPTGCSPASTTRRSPRSRPGLEQQRVRGPAADARPATAAARDGLEIHPNVWAGRRPGPRRRRHRAGRQPRGGRRPDRGVRRASASTSSCSRPTRTSRAPTGSARACCRSWRSAACWTHPAPPPPPASSVPFGAAGEGRVMSARVAVVVGNPKPRVAHPRGRASTSPASWPASPTSSSTSPTLGAGAARLGGRRTSPSWSSRSVRPTWWSWPARPTRPPTPGCSSSFLDRFAAGTGLARRRRTRSCSAPAPAHALATELTLRPVLAELGAYHRSAASTSSTPSTTTRRRTPTGSHAHSPPTVTRSDRQPDRSPA